MVGRVVVPDPVAIEPPFLLSDVLNLEPAVDVMAGAMGLVEMIFGAILLDLAGSDKAFAFRIVSDTSGDALMQDFDEFGGLSDKDLVLAEDSGLQSNVVYFSDDFIGLGVSESAAMFSVTYNPMFDLVAASCFQVEGIVALPDGVFLKTVFSFMDACA